MNKKNIKRRINHSTTLDNNNNDNNNNNNNNGTLLCNNAKVFLLVLSLSFLYLHKN